MADGDPDVGAAVREFHEETPHRFQVSLTMSMDTRDRLRRVRDELNVAAGERVFTPDDAIRLALASGARYHAAATGDHDPSEADPLVPLAASIAGAVDDDPADEVADE